MTIRTLVHRCVFLASRIGPVRSVLTTMYELAYRNDPFALCHPFDVKHQIDASGCRPGSLLHSGQRADRHVTGYAGSQPSTVERIAAEIGHPQDYTFIDIGCGKGRVLAIASNLGFRRVIGVEMSPELCRAATENSEGFARSNPGGTGIEVVQGNAAEYAMPDGNLLVFLYNPFGAQVMVSFRKTLEAAREVRGRDIVVAYVQPTYGDILDGMDGFRCTVAEWVPVTDEEKAFSRYDRYRVAIWRNTDFVAGEKGRLPTAAVGWAG